MINCLSRIAASALTSQADLWVCIPRPGDGDARSRLDIVLGKVHQNGPNVSVFEPRKNTWITYCIRVEGTDCNFACATVSHGCLVLGSDANLVFLDPMKPTGSTFFCIPTAKKITSIACGKARIRNSLIDDDVLWVGVDNARVCLVLPDRRMVDSVIFTTDTDVIYARKITTPIAHSLWTLPNSGNATFIAQVTNHSDALWSRLTADDVEETAHDQQAYKIVCVSNSAATPTEPDASDIRLYTVRPHDDRSLADVASKVAGFVGDAVLSAGGYMFRMLPSSFSDKLLSTTAVATAKATIDQMRSGTRGHTGEDTPPPPIRSATNDFELEFTSENRVFQQAVVSPCGSYILAADNLNRVFLLDSVDLIVLRIWKGYREAQCAWVVVDGVAYVVLYAPNRKMLQIISTESLEFVCQISVKVGTLVSENGTCLFIGDQPSTLIAEAARRPWYITAAGVDSMATPPGSPTSAIECETHDAPEELTTVINLSATLSALFTAMRTET